MELPGQRGEERGLARPVGPDDADSITGRDGEVDAGEDRRAVAFDGERAGDEAGGDG